MTIIEIIAIFVIHWIADFIMQDEKWALGKSKNIKDLLSHTFMYSSIWMIIGSILKVTDVVNWYPGALSSFALITFIAHTITDYFTSRIVSKRFEKEAIFNMEVSKDIFKEGNIIEHGSNKVIIMKHLNNGSKVKLYKSLPNFGAFTIIGFDQVLHYLQLFLTYYWLFKI